MRIHQILSEGLNSHKPYTPERLAKTTKLKAQVAKQKDAKEKSDALYGKDSRIMRTINSPEQKDLKANEKRQKEDDAAVATNEIAAIMKASKEQGWSAEKTAEKVKAHKAIKAADKAKADKAKKQAKTDAKANPSPYDVKKKNEAEAKAKAAAAKEKADNLAAHKRSREHIKKTDPKRDAEIDRAEENSRANDAKYKEARQKKEELKKSKEALKNGETVSPVGK